MEGVSPVGMGDLLHSCDRCGAIMASSSSQRFVYKERMCIILVFMVLLKYLPKLCYFFSKVRYIIDINTFESTR